jgi:hypothetical protein
MTPNTTIDVAQDEPQREKLMLAVGEGITQFAMIEIGLAQVYATLMTPSPGALIWATFEAAAHFETKLRILRAVTARKRDWPDGFKERFSNFLNKAKNRAGTRNKLAHWMVSHFAEHTKEGRQVSGYVLMSANLSSVERTNERLTVKQVEEFANLCGELAIELVQFGFELANAEKSAKKADDIGG